MRLMILALLGVLGLTVLWPNVVSAQTVELFVQQRAAPEEAPEIRFDEMTRAERRELLARMSDAEVRELVLEQLDRAAADREVLDDAAGIDDERLRGALGKMFAAIPEVGAGFDRAIERITEGQSGSFLGYLVLTFLGIVAAGLVVEGLFRWLTRDVWRRIREAQPDRLLLKFGYLALRIAFDVLSVGVFFAAAYGIFLLVGEEHEPARPTVLSYLTAIVLVRAVAVLARFVLAPRQPTLRLFDIATGDARAIYWWIMASATVVAVGFTTRGVLTSFGLEFAGVRLLGFIAGGVFILLLIGAVWRARRAIATLIQGDAEKHSLRGFLANVWHIVATAYLLITFAAAIIQANLTGQDMLAAGVGSLVLLALLPIADAGVCRGMGEFFGGRARNIDDDGEITLPNYEPVIRRGMRTILVVVAVLVLLALWGVPVFSLAEGSLGSRVLGGIVTVGITILIAYVLWQVIKVSIDRKLVLDGGGEFGSFAAAGEGGGATVGSRISTLLPLIRSFLLAIIVVVAAMIALSSLGVDIGPLIAGAGIVGIAVGFGAQTLVRDIVSGIFFLWDDAFRVGEYVDLGFVKGTVESISIRSMRLRHHRGALHTVPYGEVKHLTNHSRDWVIMKLEFRVTYDADIKKKKKFFKTIGAEIEQDPEMGPNLIQPLKSQGVLRMEDSAMIVRAKFMAVPGEQFLIRREVFTRVQKAFQENGIKFAHRRVTVDVPKDAREQDADDLKEQGSAAALVTEPQKPSAT